MTDILTEIVERRKKDISSRGFSLGFNLPAKRKRALHPFLKGFDGKIKRGVILEVKRASPSKGDIAPNLDAGKTGLSYGKAGASAVSCLTEENYFKGNLSDLMKVCEALDSYEKESGNPCPAVLRKDFLLSPEEVEVSFLAGADAILLIARILSEELLRKMALEVIRLGLSALVEVRTEEDIGKIASVFSDGKLKNAAGLDGNFVFGVNSRDLSNFKIDLLRPAMMRKKIRKAVGENVRVISESGVTNASCAHSVGAMGFSALLLGEAAAKNPDLRKILVDSFSYAKPAASSAFWDKYASEVFENSPLVKICGLTSIEDALAAEKAGADFLGFVFADAFPRSLSRENRMEKILPRINELSAKKAAVIVDIDSSEAKTAIKLVKEGLFDILQLHNIPYEKIASEEPEILELPHYFAVKTFEEYEKLLSLGEMRLLFDSKELLSGKNETGSLYQLRWLAGGLNEENVSSLVKLYSPELIDVSGGVEKEGRTGVKDEEKIKKFIERAKKAGDKNEQHE